MAPSDGSYSADEDDDACEDDGNEDWEDVDEEDEPPEGVTQIEYKDDLRTGAFEYFTEGEIWRIVANVDLTL